MIQMGRDEHRRRYHEWEAKEQVYAYVHAGALQRAIENSTNDVMMTTEKQIISKEGTGAETVVASSPEDKVVSLAAEVEKVPLMKVDVNNRESFDLQQQQELIDMQQTDD